MNESTTRVYRPIRRSLRLMKEWLRMKLLQALGVHQEMQRLQARAMSLQTQLEQANEVVRALACPDTLPDLPEFFDDLEILVTQRYDA